MGDRDRSAEKLSCGETGDPAWREHRQHRYLNNRAENSHQPTRQRERRIQEFIAVLNLTYGLDLGARCKRLLASYWHRTFERKPL